MEAEENAYGKVFGKAFDTFAFTVLFLVEPLRVQLVAQPQSLVFAI